MYVYRLTTRYINENKPKLTKHIRQFKNIRTINVEKSDQQSFGEQVRVMNLKR